MWGKIHISTVMEQLWDNENVNFGVHLNYDTYILPHIHKKQAQPLHICI